MRYLVGLFHWGACRVSKLGAMSKRKIKSECMHAWYPHSKNCGVKITPPVLIEDHTMHFTPVSNSSTHSGVILTPLVVILTLYGVVFKL